MASKEEVQALSEQLNRKLCELIKDPRERTWFKLFYHADSNGSRQISFKEFSAMIRDELRIAPKELPDRQIKAAWLALDKNGSGFISAGEVGGMMRRGEHVQAGFVEQKAPWQERVHSQRWQKAEEVRQTMDRLFHRDLKASMAGAPPPGTGRLVGGLLPARRGAASKRSARSDPPRHAIGHLEPDA